jgi:hypothetical protein
LSDWQILSNLCCMVSVPPRMGCSARLLLIASQSNNRPV